MPKHTNDHVADIELLTSWEGEAEHAPGVLFEEAAGNGMLPGEPVLIELTAWVAVAVISGVIGNTAYDAIKAKALGVLAALRRREGQDSLDELKEQVLIEMEKHRSNGKLSKEELKSRIDALFAEVRG